MRTYAPRLGSGTECRRYPPLLVTEGTRHTGHSNSPDVQPENWCGEWAPANPETIEDGCVVLARLVLLGDLTAARALADKLRE